MLFEAKRVLFTEEVESLYWSKCPH